MSHRRSATAIGALVVVALASAGCGGGDGGPVPTVASGVATLEVSPGDFVDVRGTIRFRHTCDGLDISPAVSWSAPPAGTVTQVLLLDDPDAPGGGFTHWLLYDLPVEVSEVSEAAGPNLGFPTGTQPGLNDFGTTGYRGPCPPPGPAHAYVLHVYGLDTQLGLPSRAQLGEVLEAMDGHIIAHGTATGIYQR